MGFRNVWFRATPGVRANGDVPWCPPGWRSVKSNGRSEHDQIPGTLAFSRCARNAQLCSAPAAGGMIAERTQTPTSPSCHGEFSISMELADQERRGNRGMRDRRGLLPCIAPQLGAAPSHWEGAGLGHASRWLNQCLDKTSSVGPAKPPLWVQQQQEHPVPHSLSTAASCFPFLLPSIP